MTSAMSAEWTSLLCRPPPSATLSDPSQRLTSSHHYPLGDFVMG